MRHGGQRSRRFERRQRERMAEKQLVARGREAARKIQRQKHGIELTQEGRLSLVYCGSVGVHPHIQCAVLFTL